ncbi:hypothetical protein [Pseudomonas fragi]|uniref:hypothetical protein n=1 Tax=Pseudomonas fragi TaxID=296 RepID=UPI00113FEF63|nr:hypothetical protein [Pseudomonas fragi]
MAYYKTSDAGVLAAWRIYRADCDKLKVLANEFAATYPGAESLVRTDWHSGRSFYGLKFTPAMPQPLWTKPDDKTGQSQFPRRALPSGTKGEERKALNAELKKLREDYEQRRPKYKADMQPFLDSMGLGGGALFFAGYKHIVTDDCLYVRTSAKPSEVMTEILGSEFEAAEQANQ